MFNLKMNYDWIDGLLPEGFPFPSSTLISGPGGNGKPLLASLFLSVWLKHGGSAIILLINSEALMK